MNTLNPRRNAIKGPAPARRKLTRIQRFTRWFRSPAGEKLTHRLPGLTVFLVGAYISYWHIVRVVSKGHERMDSALLYPIIIDAAVVVGARYLSRAKTWPGRVFAALGFVAGASYTLYCNWLASDPSLTGRILGIAPGVMVILTASTMHWGEMKAKAKARTTTPAATAPAKTPTVKAPLTATVKVPKAPATNGHAKVTSLVVPEDWRAVPVR